ncbi:stromal membrane-associated protein 1 [Bombus vosnesenskii]|uniref:Stromal membrane-associated protein 1 n=1 Tax=Bombus vosnesenskii TaxID=207650 RepID=A0A6J3JZJ0_9HYME|nr:stromal membrane-associated protein 1 [Bombus vosnesenskii]XP_033346214.1 stromal membrane-associated protein 1 [Bombus vosnesenskii]XP_033346222.1 stromal membrane-associated protein 1 [Bombus vosnesenskii]XP_033346231.1 stromal membrane-associated protein 1 [Bombus vosnesenskii]
MTSRLEKERSKQIQEKCQNLLIQMLRDEDNKYCVDCDAKGPRWASWNLGIFLCIRCAGIHRNLGVHISKVKSVNLDTWTPEQVVSLQQMGNSRARAVYEANLPDSFRRPQTVCSLESFIRAKYEHKKYIAREWVPPPLPKVNWDKELDEEAERQRRRKKENSKTSNNQAILPPVKKPEVVPQLPKPKSSVSPKPNRANNSATLDLLGLDAPAQNQTSVNGAGDDIFSSFLSAPPASVASTSNSTSNTTTNASTTISKSEEESFFDQPAPSPQEKNKMSKDSILALYGTPSNQQSAMFAVSGGMYAQQSTVQYNQIPTVAPFGQQTNFPNQQSSLTQLPTQMSVTPNQLPITQNQITVNSTSLGPVASNTLGNCLHVGQINQMNGVPNPAITMQSQMVMQLGQSNINSNNGWSGMLTQNLQPAPGSNPFFNLTSQQQQQSVTFSPQLPQQMAQLSLGGTNFSSTPGKSTATTTLPGQTLSTNLWQ